MLFMFLVYSSFDSLFAAVVVCCVFAFLAQCLRCGKSFFWHQGFCFEEDLAYAIQSFFLHWICALEKLCLREKATGACPFRTGKGAFTSETGKASMTSILLSIC